MEVFVLVIEWPAAVSEPRDRELTDVASFVVENVDNFEETIEILKTVQRGETYHGGGGAVPEFSVSAVSPETLREHLDIAAFGSGKTMDVDFENDISAAQEFPDISEFVDAMRDIVRQHVARPGNSGFDDLFLAALERARKLIADADAAMDANFGEGV